MTGIVNYECFNGAVSAIAGNYRIKIVRISTKDKRTLATNGEFF